jgi:hypothetical protein
MSTFTQVSITRMTDLRRLTTIRERGLDEKRAVRFAARMRIGLYVSAAGIRSIDEADRAGGADAHPPSRRARG